LCTTSPGCTIMCLPCGMRCSSSWAVSSFFTSSRRLPRIEPSEVDHAIDPGHLGPRLSGGGPRTARHARETAGDILVLDAWRGVFASNAPGEMVSPSLTTSGLRPESSRRRRLARGVAHLDLRIEVFLVFDDHRRNAAVDSSSSRFTVTPGIMSLKVSAPPFQKVPERCRDPTAPGPAPVDLLAVTDGDDRADDDVVGLELLVLSSQSGSFQSC